MVLLRGRRRPDPAWDDLTLVTADGIRLAAGHRASARGSDLGFVLVHGFTGAHDSQAIRRAADVLVGTGGVLAVSLRGHGRSAGASTLGDLEVDDVSAAVVMARRLGYERVVTVGFSMGGSVVVRQAALRPRGEQDRVDAVVSISAPSRWYYRGTSPMRRLHTLVGSRGGRAAVRWVRRTRVVERDWTPPYPMEPREAARRMAPTPLLVAHGDADHYFPVDHAHQLAAAGDHVELWVEYGFEHAENAISDELTARVAAWADATTQPAAVPLPAAPVGRRVP